MNTSNSLRKNPSRQTCEGIIKRILNTEVIENGRNLHFKSATDFMTYFESLYLASDALTKQVQRAIKALSMPKDENGFLIVNKTTAQLEQEQELSRLFQLSNVTVDPMEHIETVFLSADAFARSYIIHLLEVSDICRDKILTLTETYNGILIYTQDKDILLEALNSLTI